jgi:hypothetical protein
MTANGSFAIVNASGASHPRNLVARVTKARAASDFRNDTTARDGTANRFAAAPHAQNLSQSETGEHAPLWYGPRLRPAFVAQVLGQLLYPAPPDATSAAAAYEEGLARALPDAGLDRHV